MMHPGLVPPTPVERCMQLAYTAKVNSGCISRQTGAVVTDSEYNIISLGWNDVPYGQTPCIYRNLLDLQRQNDKGAFSDYEWENNSPFQINLQKYDFSMAASLNGLPASFCFKTLNEKVTGEKNPMKRTRDARRGKSALTGTNPEDQRRLPVYDVEPVREVQQKTRKSIRLVKSIILNRIRVSRSGMCATRVIPITVRSISYLKAQLEELIRSFIHQSCRIRMS